MFQTHNIRKPTQPWLIVCIALFAFVFGGCSFLRLSPPGQAEQTEKLEEAMGKGGYAPARGFAIDSVHDIWMHEATELQVMMTAPTAPGSYPLIVYLPTVGEDAKAGQLWRETWAKAGYAVFSMQPVASSRALRDLRPKQGGEFDEPDEDDGLDPSDSNRLDGSEERDGWFGEKRRRPSRAARNSELRYLGHEYFGTANLKNRMEQLFWAFQQVKNRAGSRQPLFASADLSNVILAGYDLGAQTVSAVLGENFGADLPSGEVLKPVAAILLSPSVSLAEGNVRGRFQKLNAPMLAITGSDDNDPYAISSPLVRTAVWEYAPAGNKYLLLLKAGRHRLFAGSETGWRLGQNRRGEGDVAPPEGMLSRDAGGRDARMTERFPVEGARKDADMGYKHVAAIFSVSTAFLDAVVKNDPFANLWLDEKAGQWLGKAGSLKRR